MKSRSEIARKIWYLRGCGYRSHLVGTYVGRWDTEDKPEYVLRWRGIITQPDAFRGCYSVSELKRVQLLMALRQEKTALLSLKQGHDMLII